MAWIPVDIFWVSVAAIAQLLSPRSPRGEMRAVRFRHGAIDDGRDVGRRALAEGAGSLAPNTIVIGVDEERDLLIVHQLRPSGGRNRIDVLELG